MYVCIYIYIYIYRERERDIIPGNVVVTTLNPVIPRPRFE